MPTNSSHSVALARVSRSLALVDPGVTSSRYTFSPGCPCTPMATFCRQLSRWNSRTSWNERTMPWRAMLSGDMPTSSRPFSMTDPRSGGMKPVSRLNTVVLPAPLGPTRATMAPLRSVNVRSSAATMPPKRLDEVAHLQHHRRGLPQRGAGPARPPTVTRSPCSRYSCLGLGQLLHARADRRLPVLPPEHLQPAGPLPSPPELEQRDALGQQTHRAQGDEQHQQDAVADEHDEEGLLGVEADRHG